MQRVALYGTLVVVLNAVANLLHTISHVGQPPQHSATRRAGPFKGLRPFER